VPRRPSLQRERAAWAHETLLVGVEREGDTSKIPSAIELLDKAEALTYASQRALVSPTALAREYSEADISKDFKANGSTDVDDDEYRTLDEMLAEIAAVTAEDVAAVAAEFFAPDRQTIVRLGPNGQ